MLNKSLISCLVLRRGDIFCRLLHITLTAHRHCGRKPGNKSLEQDIGGNVHNRRRPKRQHGDPGKSGSPC